jgi:hypothetical protein
VAWMLCESLVRHKVGQSTGTTNNVMGRLFMSRNCLKLACRYAGARLPVWIGRWAVDYLVKPTLKGEFRLARAGLEGLATQQIAGSDIVARHMERHR